MTDPYDNCECEHMSVEHNDSSYCERSGCKCLRFRKNIK